MSARFRPFHTRSSTRRPTEAENARRSGRFTQPYTSRTSLLKPSARQRLDGRGLARRLLVGRPRRRAAEHPLRLPRPEVAEQPHAYAPGVSESPVGERVRAAEDALDTCPFELLELGVELLHVVDGDAPREVLALHDDAVGRTFLLAIGRGRPHVEHEVEDDVLPAPVRVERHLRRQNAHLWHVRQLAIVEQLAKQVKHHPFESVSLRCGALGGRRVSAPLGERGHRSAGLLRRSGLIGGGFGCHHRITPAAASSGPEMPRRSR